MKRANVIRGRIQSHSAGFGTSDETLVMERARQIAVTNGRRAEECNQADIAQAREELSAGQNAPPDEMDEEMAEGAVVRDGPYNISTGTQAPTKVATDEQALPEDLVNEGLDEAAHDRMVAGNAESRRRDEEFEDQLPSGSA